MGTKNNPGKFDCYQAAGDDEPMFVLVGHDPVAAATVRFWAEVRLRMGAEREDHATGPEKLAEAMACARQLERWAMQVEGSVTCALAARCAAGVFDDSVDLGTPMHLELRQALGIEPGVPHSGAVERVRSLVTELRRCKRALDELVDVIGSRGIRDAEALAQVLDSIPAPDNAR